MSLLNKVSNSVSSGAVKLKDAAADLPAKVNSELSSDTLKAVKAVFIITGAIKTADWMRKKGNKRWVEMGINGLLGFSFLIAALNMVGERANKNRA